MPKRYVNNSALTLEMIQLWGYLTVQAVPTENEIYFKKIVPLFYCEIYSLQKAINLYLHADLITTLSPIEYIQEKVRFLRRQLEFLYIESSEEEFRDIVNTFLGELEGIWETTQTSIDLFYLLQESFQYDLILFN